MYVYIHIHIAISTYALPVPRYPPGIIIWPKEEIEAPDIKTRNIFTLQAGLHPKSSTPRL